MPQPITDEQIEIIKARFAETGSVTKAARSAGVALSTAHKYAGSRDAFESVRSLKRMDIIDKVAQVQMQLIEAMADPSKVAKADIQSLATAFAIVTDKHLLLSGQATVRTESLQRDPGSLTPEEREELRQLREKLMRERI